MVKRVTSNHGESITTYEEKVQLIEPPCRDSRFDSQWAHIFAFFFSFDADLGFAKYLERRKCESFCNVFTKIYNIVPSRLAWSAWTRVGWQNFAKVNASFCPIFSTFLAEMVWKAIFKFAMDLLAAYCIYLIYGFKACGHVKKYLLHRGKLFSWAQRRSLSNGDSETSWNLVVITHRCWPQPSFSPEEEALERERWRGSANGQKRICTQTWWRERDCLNPVRVGL